VLVAVLGQKMKRGGGRSESVVGREQEEESGSRTGKNGDSGNGQKAMRSLVLSWGKGRTRTASLCISCDSICRPDAEYSRERDVDIDETTWLGRVMKRLVNG
jgi:hypothetical protein